MQVGPGHTGWGVRKGGGGCGRRQKLKPAGVLWVTAGGRVSELSQLRAGGRVKFPALQACCRVRRGGHGKGQVCRLQDTRRQPAGVCCSGELWWGSGGHAHCLLYNQISPQTQNLKSSNATD